MEKQNWRVFLQTSATVLGSGLDPIARLHPAPSADSIHSRAIHAPAVTANQGKSRQYVFSSREI